MKVTVLLPAKDENLSIIKVITSLHKVMRASGLDYEVLVVDDGSQDNTGELAAKAGARVIRHAYNMGNGAAIKTGIRYAKGDVIVMMDADDQHDPKDIPYLLAEIGAHGMVVGARIKDSETVWHRNLANKIYNLFASYVCGRSIPDLTSGFRVLRADLGRGFLYLLPNSFSYPTTLTLAIMRSGHCVKYVSIKTSKRKGSSKINIFRDGFRFLVIITKIAVLFSPIKIFGPISISMFVLGWVWYLYSLLDRGAGFPPASIIMIVASVVILMMGLVSEQISQMRYDRSEVNTPLRTPETSFDNKGMNDRL